MSVVRVAKSALLQYSAQQLFALVADVESYPKFVPRCHRASIVSQQDNQLVAELGVKFAGFDFSFSTLNSLEPVNRISLELHTGPFKTLTGEWLFQELDQTASKVSLTIDFEFDNLFSKAVFSSAFESVLTAQFDAFQKRAIEVHGAPNASD